MSKDDLSDEDEIDDEFQEDDIDDEFKRMAQVMERMMEMTMSSKILNELDVDVLGLYLSIEFKGSMFFCHFARLILPSVKLVVLSCVRYFVCMS